MLDRTTLLHLSVPCSAALLVMLPACFSPAPFVEGEDAPQLGSSSGDEDTTSGDGESSNEDTDEQPDADDSDEGPVESTSTGEPDPSTSTGEPEQPDLPIDALWSQDFEGAPLGPYTPDQLASEWGNPEWFDGLLEGRVTVTEDPETFDRSLRIEYPAGAYGGADSGASWLLRLDDSYEELWLSYRFRLGDDFDFGAGGRLPGLVGGQLVNSAVPDGSDGWSARGAWRSDAASSIYLYHMDQPQTYGEHFEWDQPHDRYFAPGQWIEVEHHVRMNTPGLSDGLVECWFDGELAVHLSELRFRETSELAIDALHFNTFFGGQNPEDAPTVDQYIDFDDFIVATSPIGTP